ncbi:MAG: T9SS type A sorting domain-containing protein, partial [Flavobacteriales bacterium]|nr:T9SS type A sorting domain-containing protein [Flavobacteriales bacterium]
WRSNSSVGHMHIGYTGNRGMYFSDRNLNGIYGSLVADTVPLPSGTYVHFDVSREGDSLIIDRNGTQVASSYFVDNLSPLSTTTIGYSEDFRYDHASFMLDNLTLTANPIASIFEYNTFPVQLYPNPAIDELNYSSSERIEGLRIYDVFGKELILNFNLTSGQLDISKLKEGLYFLEVESESGISVKRFSKI